MTDETTARDRAIELIHETLAWERERGAAVEEHADVVVDALLAHPEVLRALAGAPTADVATPRGVCPVCGEVVSLVLDVHGHFGPGVEAEDETFCDASHAAPEGVDAADERATSVERMAHVEEVANLQRHLGYAQAGVTALLRRLDELEGKDRGLTYIDIAEVRRLLDAPLAWEADAQQTADDLTAAQAAIQRVREEHRPTHDGYCVVCASWDPITGASGVPWPCPTKVALDGDTTEEGA